MAEKLTTKNPATSNTEEKALAVIDADIASEDNPTLIFSSGYRRTGQSTPYAINSNKRGCLL